MFACVQVPVFALGQDDLLLEISEFQMRRIRGALQVLGADLPGENAGLCPVLGLDAEAHLVQDKFCLLFAIHGTKSLDLQLAQDLTGRLDVAIMVLLQIRKYLGDAGTLDLDKDLTLGHCPQGLDDLNLPVDVGNVAQDVDDGLDHPLDGLLELAMFLGEDGNLVAEQVPIAGAFAEVDNGNEESGCRCEIGSLFISGSEAGLDNLLSVTGGSPGVFASRARQAAQWLLEDCCSIRGPTV